MLGFCEFCLKVRRTRKITRHILKLECRQTAYLYLVACQKSRCIDSAERDGLIDIKDHMGHASIKTTAIYTEVVNKGRGERHRKTSPRKILPFDS